MRNLINYDQLRFGLLSWWPVSLFNVKFNHLTNWSTFFEIYNPNNGVFDLLNRFNDIRIGYNKIKHLPSELGYSRLNELLVNDNPLVTPSEEVCRRGTQAILQYLKDLDQSETFNSAKVIVVGDSMVGKMSLLKSLANRKPALQDEVDWTVGLDCIQWYPLINNATLSFEFLDYAGQDSYVEVLSLHLTQRQRSTYMLLVSALEIHSQNGRWKSRAFRWMVIALSRDSWVQFTVVMSRGGWNSSKPNRNMLEWAENCLDRIFTRLGIIHTHGSE